MSQSEKRGLPAGLPPWVQQNGADKGTQLEVALSRDARDSTLGIDLDQFTGKPTVAVVVPGGPAERDGTVRPGDIILAVDGIDCSSIAEVIEVLSSPSASAKNPLSVKLLRKAKFAVADDLLLVRAMSASAAADGLAGLLGGDKSPRSPRSSYGNSKSGGLQQLTNWVLCRCALMSDRRMCVSEQSMGIDAAFDLRATESVQLILTTMDRDAKSDAARRSCLQVRTADGIVEFCSPNPSNAESSVLLAWQRPLEDMLMISLSSSCKSWLQYLAPPDPDLSSSTAMVSGSRIFLDLNSHSQLRTIVDGPDSERGTHLGVIELAELQKIELVQLSEPPVGNTGLRNATHALSISTAETTCSLASEDPARTKLWASELEVAHKAALVTLVQYTGMILIDGWLEYQGDEDEWASGFFILTIGSGLQCFEDMVSEPMLAEAIETLTLEQITGAVRSKGIDYYDWCIDVRTTDGDYIRVRPPRQAEMTRWLATINLYCTPPPKKKPERPRRRSQSQVERSEDNLSNMKKDVLAANPRQPGSARMAAVPAADGNMVAPPSWGGAGAAFDDSSASSIRRRSMQFPVNHGEQNPGQYPGLLAGWNAAPLGDESEKPRMVARASSFGRRGRNLSFTRRPSSSSIPDSDPVAMPAPAPVGPSRGGRLRSAKNKAEAEAPAADATSGGTSTGASYLGMRRPSFARRRPKTMANLAEAVADYPRPDPMKLQPLEVSLPGERRGGGNNKLRARASSFTRVRRRAPAGMMLESPNLAAQPPPQQQPSRSFALPTAIPPAPADARPSLSRGMSSTSNSTAPSPGRADARPPAQAPAAPAPAPTRAPSFGRRLARRAASFTRRSTKEKDLWDKNFPTKFV